MYVTLNRLFHGTAYTHSSFNIAKYNLNFVIVNTTTYNIKETKSQFKMLYKQIKGYRFMCTYQFHKSIQL